MKYLDLKKVTYGGHIEVFLERIICMKWYEDLCRRFH